MSYLSIVSSKTKVKETQSDESLPYINPLGFPFHYAPAPPPRGLLASAMLHPLYHQSFFFQAVFFLKGQSVPTVLFSSSISIPICPALSWFIFNTSFRAPNWVLVALQIKSIS